MVSIPKLVTRLHAMRCQDIQGIAKNILSFCVEIFH